MDVSVIIPVYNRECVLWRALRSVVAQTVPPAEIIVVDDASRQPVVLPDSLGGIPLRLIGHAFNRGGAAARNSGIDAARSEWVAFLDSDDEWLPHKLDSQSAALAQGRSRAEPLVASDTIVRKEGEADRAYNGTPPSGPLCVWLLGGHGTLQTSTLMLRRELARRVRFDEALPCAQDWDFVLRAVREGAATVYVDEPLAIYHATITRERISEGDLVEPFLAWFDKAGTLLTPAARQIHYVRALLPAHARSSPGPALQRLIRYLVDCPAGIPRFAAFAAPRALRRLKEGVRWDEWYASKIPFVWTACATAALTSSLGARALLLRTAALILFVSLCGAFGYAANDLADRECDRVAGKPSALSRLPERHARRAVSALGVAALASLALAASRPISLALGIGTLVLATLYSLPPVRLKERGAAGLWSAAAAQRTLPVLLAFAALGRLDAVAWAMAAAAQLAGLRAMLVHQIEDADNDCRAGVSTYVTAAGRSRAGILLRRAVLPAELVAVPAALSAAALSIPFYWCVGAAGLLASAVWTALSLGVQRAYSLEKWDRQPLAGFYESVWPLGAATLLLANRFGLWPLAAAFLVWERRLIRHRLAQAARLLLSRRPPGCRVPGRDGADPAPSPTP